MRPEMAEKDNLDVLSLLAGVWSESEEIEDKVRLKEQPRVIIIAFVSRTNHL